MKGLKSIFNLFSNSSSDSFDDIDYKCIVSSGRTGTQFFGQFFDHFYENLISRHEPRPDLFNIFIEKYRNKAGTEELVTFLRKDRLALVNECRKSPSQVLIESNPNASLLIPELKLTFPSHKFLWIVRDPKTYLKSAYSKSPDGSGEMMFYGENDHRDRLKPSDLTESENVDWDRFDRFQKICWYWNAINKILYSNLKDDNNCLMLRYEDLFSKEDNLHYLLKVLDFFELDHSEIDLDRVNSRMLVPSNQTKFSMIRSYDDWDKNKTDSFEALTSEMRSILNY